MLNYEILKVAILEIWNNVNIVSYGSREDIKSLHVQKVHFNQSRLSSSKSSSKSTRNKVINLRDHGIVLTVVKMFVLWHKHLHYLFLSQILLYTTLGSLSTACHAEQSTFSLEKSSFDHTTDSSFFAGWLSLSSLYMDKLATVRW